MQIFDIARKDLRRVFHSVFALVMMFGAPLLLAGLMYFAFGGLSGGGNAFHLARTRVVIVNLDQGAASSDTFKAGEMLISFLKDDSLVEMLEITTIQDEASARSAVDQQKADVALIIPANFTQAAMVPGHNAAVLLYQDPTLTVGPGIVKDLVNHFMDGFSGAKIAGTVIQANNTQPAASLREWAAKQYASYLESSDHAEALHIVSPSGEAKQAKSMPTMMGPIMAGMLIFFVFFMGANGAESILREHEDGTLARLFSTPVSALQILFGKFIGVFVTLVIQTVVLLAVSALLFKISWGKPLSLTLATLSLIVAATGFGVMLMAFIKSMRQTGPVLGGVMTITGMLGGLFTSSIPNVPEVMDKVSLSMPQGWALHTWKLSLSGSSAAAIVLPALALTILGGIFFAVGLTMFRRRFS